MFQSIPSIAVNKKNEREVVRLGLICSKASKEPIASTAIPSHTWQVLSEWASAGLIESSYLGEK